MKKTRILSKIIYVNLFLLAFGFISCKSDIAEDTKQEVGTSSSKERDTLVISAQPFKLSGESSVDNLKFHWNKMEDADFYRLYRLDSPSGTLNLIKTTESTVYDVYNITSFDEYYKVKAFSGNKVVGESDAIKCEGIYSASSLNEYDNTKYTALIQPSCLEFDGIYYSYTYSNSNGLVTLTENTSTDGLNFTTGNIVITGDSSNEDFYSEDLASCKLEAMSIVKKNDKIVIWAHYENASNYALGKAICIYGKPGDGTPFETAGSFWPQGHDSRDMTFFEDDDGTGYIISATNTNSDLNIYKLTDDWTDIDDNFSAVTVCDDDYREAPSLIKQDGWYYLFSSAAAGWYPSNGGYISSSTINGLADQDLNSIGNNSTFGAQSGGVTKIGDKYVMMANRWSGGWAYPDPVLSASGNWSAQRMLPISLVGGYAFYDYYYKVEYDCISGIVVPVQSGKILSLGKEVECSDSTDGYGPEMANNGISYDKSDLFKPSTDSTSYYWSVDLEKPYVITEVDATFYCYKGSETCNKYVIYGSNDNETWTEIKDNSSNVIIGFNENIVDESSTAYQYVKIAVAGIINVNNGNSASWTRGVHEITVLGKEGD